jgi:type II secretory ATPase GspE/PulE/Tfp pilus assembly ATPase PilB-like protein
MSRPGDKGVSPTALLDDETHAVGNPGASRDAPVAADSSARESVIRDLVGGEESSLPESRRLAEPAADRVPPEVLERAAQAANALPRNTAERLRAVVLDRPSPTSFRVGLVNEWNVDARRAAARALCTTTQFINFEALTEGQFARIFAHAYGNQTAQDSEALAQARETKEWASSRAPSSTPAQGTASDVERGAASFTGTRAVSEVTRTVVIDISDDAEMVRLSRVPLDALDIQDFNRLSLWYFVRAKASDYHLECGRRLGGRIRFSIDGVPSPKFKNIPLEITARAGNSLAQMAGVDFSEMKRRPLNSAITLLASRGGRAEEVELRFASMPTTPLPEITLRSQSEVITDIQKLGLLKPHYALVREAMATTQGIFLVTGPTGSGKTNSLAAYLAEIEKLDNRKIIEMADPIEIFSDFRSQMQITKTNSWDDGFQAMLRNAPQICVVGELRSKHVVAVTMEAATTGHLVFATYHTSNVETTFTRLSKMGVPPEQLADSLVCVQAQRLVRTLCKCKVVDEVESAAHGQVLYKPRGCPVCLGIGYKGRTSIPEILLVNEDVKDWMAGGMAGAEIVRRAHDAGRMILMEEVARVKVLAGLTDFKEVERVAKFAEAKSREEDRAWAANARARSEEAPTRAATERGGPPPVVEREDDAIDAEYEVVGERPAADDPLDLA